jgi:hypothetical protein
MDMFGVAKGDCTPVEGTDMYGYERYGKRRIVLGWL